MATGQQKQWSNWSGSVRSTLSEIATPTSLDELRQLVKSCAATHRTLRVVGAGHSFTPLVETTDVLISLDKLQGLIEVDKERGTATVWGGTRLKLLGDALFAHGLAQENLGDINVQSIAGAISTGTHGTGIRFGSIATQVVGLTLVTATGDLLECSPQQNPEIFKAAQVSLGTLGIIAKVTLRLVPAKRLHYRSHQLRLSECLANLEQFKQENSHFEFYWFPYTEWTQVKFLNEMQEDVSKSTLWADFSKIVLENGAFWLLSEACRLVPRLCPTVSNISARAIPSVDEINYSHRVFSTPRVVRFQEMEYNIPAQYMATVVQEIKDCIDRHHFNVHFPIECRFVHQDDIWLSPAYQRDSAYIAVHMYRGMPYRDYFRHIEEIFKRYEGRPHWGKMHTRTSQELAQLYPHWNNFRRIRNQLDPQQLFINPYLNNLLDVDEEIIADRGASPSAANENSKP